MKMRRLDDSAHTQVLESVVLASIMISAVTFVVTFETPVTGSASTRELVKQQLEDALSILYDTPIQDSNFGTNALSVYIAECLQDDCDNLTGKLDKLLPEGASYALYVSNGHSTYPVYVSHEPQGETVTSTHLLEPSWSNSFVATGTDLVNPLEDPLLVYSLPIFNSNVLSPGGSPLRILLHATDASTGADFTLTAYASTQAYDVTDAGLASAVSLYFIDADGDPLPMTDPGNPLFIDGLTEPIPHRLTVRLDESAGVAVPAGTNLTISLPRGWSGVANETLNDGHWTLEGDATSADGGASGGDIYAVLEHDVEGDVVDFVFDAYYHGDVLDYYPIHATLSRGAMSSATILVRGETHATTPSHQAPAMYLSVPRPMGATATTTWTLSAIVPGHTDADPTQQNAYFVDEIVIEEAEGNAIFGAVEGLETQLDAFNLQGSWRSEGDRLVWTGTGQFLSSISALNMSFRVTASGTAGPSESRTPFFAPITFDAGTGRILTQHAPGFFRDNFLPANADKDYVGYYNNTGSLYVDETIETNLVYRATELPGETTFTTGAASPLRTAIYGSYVSVDDRSVPVGGEVVMTADVQSLLFKLAEAGHEAGLTVNFYPPWTGDVHDPIYTETSLDSGLLTSQPTHMLLHELNGDGIADPVIATDNGRVFALDAVTGARLPDLAYTASLREDLVELPTAADVLAFEKLTLPSGTHFVVGTDSASTGLIVLDESFEPVWTYDTNGHDVVALETATDMTGDGRMDVVAAVSVADASAIFVLEALDGYTTLRAVAPAIPVDEVIPLVDGVPVLSNADLSGVAEAFYIAPGAASALVGLPANGVADAQFAVTIQTIADADVDVNIDTANPSAPVTPVYSSPRVGLQGVDADGTGIFTFFGSPITKALSYDYDAYGATDVVAAGPAGYVFMLNGTQAAQPIYSLLLTGPESVVDADSRSMFESYILTDDGSIYYTDDGWGSTYCVNCDPITQINVPIPTANALAVNGTASLWIAGAANTLYRSVEDTGETSSTLASALAAAPAPKPILMRPQTLNGVKFSGGASVPFDFESFTRDFTDLHFGSGANADHGWVIGKTCGLAVLDCEQSFIMRTEDGGATWRVASSDDIDHQLNALDGGVVSGTLNKLFFVDDTYGWVVGANGAVLRSTDGGVTWDELPAPADVNLLDVHCIGATPSRCFVVGEAGAAYMTTNPLADPAAVAWSAMPVADDIGARTLYSVGFKDATVGYIGTTNAVLQTFDGGDSWTTLPLNYVENDGRVINIFDDGTGYIYGGGSANARIWFLQDFATESIARTNVLTPGLPAGARITSVDVERSNISSNDGSNVVHIYATTNGEDWTYMIPNLESTEGRNVQFVPTAFGPDAGNALRLEMQLFVDEAKTLLSPSVRDLDLTVHYLTADGVEESIPVSLDFASDEQVDASATTAEWDADVGMLRSAIVGEHWVRNVSGEVLDLLVGPDANADGRGDVWVATGDVLSLNSPDYAIYAGPDKSQALSSDNRIYLLDAADGSVLVRTEPLVGEVVSIELVDSDGDGADDTLYAVTAEATSGSNRLYVYDATTLGDVHTMTLPSDALSLEAGLGGPDGDDETAYVGVAIEDANVVGGGRILAMDTASLNETWRVIPDDRGYYLITTEIPENWFFGPYVVEVVAEWEDTLPGGDEVLRSARVYDYFVVTPPDSVSPASPIYDVHLVAWFDDWR